MHRTLQARSSSASACTSCSAPAHVHVTRLSSRAASTTNARKLSSVALHSACKARVCMIQASSAAGSVAGLAEKASTQDKIDFHGVHHVGLLVKDLKKAKAFYCDTLGVESIVPVEERLKAKDIPYTKSKSGRAAVFFRDPDMNVLEVFETKAWR